MAEVTTCQLINSVDKKLMTVSTKWSDDRLELFILREGLEPLKAEVQIAKLTEPADNFSKTPEDYLQELKRELSGAASDVDFSLKNRKFHWKKKAWKRGAIDCQPIEEIVELSNSFITILTTASSLEKSAADLKAENDSLRIRSQNLESILNDLIESKNRMEEELYSRFLVLLNSKKRKNRELLAKLEKKDPIYDESTDLSDDEDQEMESKTFCRIDDVNVGASTSGAHQQSEDSDESFVLRFSQSSPKEDSRKTNRKKDSEEESQDLFSD